MGGQSGSLVERLRFLKRKYLVSVVFVTFTASTISWDLLTQRRYQRMLEEEEANKKLASKTN